MLFRWLLRSAGNCHKPTCPPICRYLEAEPCVDSRVLNGKYRDRLAADKDDGIVLCFAINGIMKQSKAGTLRMADWHSSQGYGNRVSKER